MKPISFELSGGSRLTFFHVNFSLVVSPSGVITIEDGTHMNGGWHLADHYTYEQVIQQIVEATT